MRSPCVLTEDKTRDRMDYGKQSATINVELFGRETPVEISFAEVMKLDR